MKKYCASAPSTRSCHRCLYLPLLGGTTYLQVGANGGRKSLLIVRNCEDLTFNTFQPMEPEMRIAGLSRKASCAASMHSKLCVVAKTCVS